VGLVKILGEMLAQLYTTTDRRGGADKIKQLDLDLQVWTSNYNSHPHVEPIILGDSGRKRANSNCFDEYVAIGHWLKLLANFCRILIHRPGLTFDRDTVQFRECLIACNSSATAITSLLGDDSIDPRLRIFIPSGPSLVFQSALLLVFSHCHRSGEGPNLVTFGARDLGLIDESIEVLHGISADYVPSSSPGDSSAPRKPPVMELIDTLQCLQRFLASIEQSKASGNQVQRFDFTSPMSSTILGSETDAHQQALHLDVDLDFWGTGGLQDLNQIGHMDEIFGFNPLFNNSI
jgi:hypothetical protein